jgi:hypothetical protein
MLCGANLGGKTGLSFSKSDDESVIRGLVSGIGFCLYTNRTILGGANLGTKKGVRVKEVEQKHVYSVQELGVLLVGDWRDVVHGKRGHEVARSVENLQNS